MIRIALWLLQQYHLTLNADQIPLYALTPRRDMTTALPPAPEWSHGEQYETILRRINGEPRVESGFIPGPQDRATLRATDAPHETGAVLRAFQAGMPAHALSKHLGKSLRQVQLEMTINMDDQTDAGLKAVPVYNDKVVVCSKCKGPMNLIAGTSSFRCPVDGTSNFSATTKVS